MRHPDDIFREWLNEVWSGWGVCKYCGCHVPHTTPDDPDVICKVCWAEYEDTEEDKTEER